MKFSVETTILKNAFSRVVHVLDKRNINPLLSSCLIEFKGSELQISGTDLEVSAKVIVPMVDIEDVSNIKFCVNAAQLYNILGELSNDLITFDVDLGENVLSLTYNRMSCSMIIASANDYPTLNFEANEGSFTLNTSNVEKIINTTSYAISNDEIRLFLNGIYIEKVDGNLRAVATDGYKLSLIDIPMEEGQGDILDNGIIIPKKGVNELKRMCDNLNDEDLLFSSDSSFIYVTSKNKEYSLAIRPIAHDFIKYQTVIPKKASNILVADKKTFIEALRRVKIFSNEKTNALKIHLNSTELQIESSDSYFGKAKEVISVEYTGREMTIGLNSKILLETLSTLTGEKIQMQFNNELVPFIVKDFSNESHMALISPMRL